MTTKELEDIIDELLFAPEVFRESIKCYNAMRDDDPNKKQLGEAISNAKFALTELDVIFQDMLWSMERFEVVKQMDIE